MDGEVQLEEGRAGIKSALSGWGDNGLRAFGFRLPGRRGLKPWEFAASDAALKRRSSTIQPQTLSG